MTASADNCPWSLGTSAPWLHLLPTNGIGSQVQQPLACVIVGGMLLSPICSLLVIPTVARLAMGEVPGTVGEGRTEPEPA